MRWDSLHYLAIAQHGYSTLANTVFFPLYPALIAALAALTGSFIIAGEVINTIAFCCGIAPVAPRDECGDRVADATVLLLAFSPVSLFFTALDTESLFLPLALGTFMLARRGQLGWTCVSAGAALTHAEGVLLIAPLAIFHWQQRVA